MERARYNTELYSNPGPLLNNVKPSNFLGSHHTAVGLFFIHFPLMPGIHILNVNFTTRKEKKA